jgi:hypothetical protein
LPAVVLDLAEAHVQMGDVVPAGKVVRRYLRQITRPAERIRALTIIAQSAGDDPVHLFSTAWFEALELLDEVGETELAAQGHLDLARAASAALCEAHADRAVLRARDIAARLGLASLVQDCEAFLRRSRFSAGQRGAVVSVPGSERTSADEQMRQAGLLDCTPIRL